MLIGITGTDGAGKGAVVQYLVQKKGFTHYSAREFIMAEIKRLGLPTDRNQMRLTANKLRAAHGDAFVVKQAYDKAQKEGVENVVIESIRALAEAVFLKDQGGILLAVDAAADIRYTRVQGRRSESDKVSYEQFLAHEALEKNDPDPHGMQKAKVIQMADHTILNERTLTELYAQTDGFLKKFSALK